MRWLKSVGKFVSKYFNCFFFAVSLGALILLVLFMLLAPILFVISLVIVTNLVVFSGASAWFFAIPAGIMILWIIFGGFFENSEDEEIKKEYGFMP